MRMIQKHPCALLRLQRLWEEEVAKSGLEKASLLRTILRFQRTRLIISVMAGVLAMVSAFVGPVSQLHLVKSFKKGLQTNLGVISITWSTRHGSWFYWVPASTILTQFSTSLRLFWYTRSWIMSATLLSQLRYMESASALLCSPPSSSRASSSRCCGHSMCALPLGWRGPSAYWPTRRSFRSGCTAASPWERYSPHLPTSIWVLKQKKMGKKVLGINAYCLAAKKSAPPQKTINCN